MSPSDRAASSSTDSADACGKIAAAADAPETAATIPNGLVAAACCKLCRKGKACGDSCISRAKTCWKGPGCACDGYAHAAPGEDLWL